MVVRCTISGARRSAGNRLRHYHWAKCDSRRENHGRGIRQCVRRWAIQPLRSSPTHRYCRPDRLAAYPPQQPQPHGVSRRRERASHAWRPLFARERLAATSTDTKALSSRFEFMTSAGWRYHHFIVTMRHISNGRIVGGGRTWVKPCYSPDFAGKERRQQLRETSSQRTVRGDAVTLRRPRVGTFHGTVAESRRPGHNVGCHRRVWPVPPAIPPRDGRTRQFPH